MLRNTGQRRIAALQNVQCEGQQKDMKMTKQIASARAFGVSWCGFGHLRGLLLHALQAAREVDRQLQPRL